MVKLTRRTFDPLLLEGVGYRLVVREDDELAGFQHVAEMLHGFVDRKQLPIICAIFLFRRAELSGEEGEGLPVDGDITGQ
jgi:hypothetical protein